MSAYPPPPPPAGGPYGGYPSPSHPQAVVVLVLGIVSIVACQVLGPVAWVMGNRALGEIDASGGAIGGRDQVQAGRICGIIGTVLLGLSVLFFVVWLAFAGTLMAGSFTFGA